MNKSYIALLLQEFRNWERDWDAYESNPKHYNKPIDCKKFIELLNKHYKVKIKKNE